MIFSSLYGDELDREIGSADRTKLFTAARRKAAINAAQLEWVKRTECFTRIASVTLVDDTQEVDLEASVSDYGWLAKAGISVQIVNGTNTRYIEGDGLEVTTIERLNQEEPGWRAVSAGTPQKVYIRRVGGTLLLGLHPKPSFTDGDTWTALVTYVAVPADMTLDADEPFTVSGNALISLRPWHRALAYFAAYDLEKYRKDTARASAALQLWEVELQKFSAAEKPKGGQRVRLIKNYRRVMTATRMVDPRT
jgi:hypothetical protein